MNIAAPRYDKAQARCLMCNVRHTWLRKAGPAVAAAICPTCEFPLHRTTGQISLRLTTLDWAGALGIGESINRPAGSEAREAQAYYAATIPGYSDYAKGAA